MINNLECKDFLGWTDWLDEELRKLTGEFHVHRNYIEKDGQYRFTPYKSVVDPSSNTMHLKDSKGKSIYIGDTPPIAKGITAYFIWDHGSKKCLKSLIELNLNFDTNSYYKFYFDYCFDIRVKANNRLPKPQPVETLRMEYLFDHLVDEKRRFTESSKYFDEKNNEDENHINIKLKKYVESYLEWVENMQSNSDIETGNYVLKNESVILKLFEEYGGYFPVETKEVWKKRWINGKKSLRKINVDNFKNGNNKHLLLTILYEAHPFMKVDKMEDYTKRRWGLKAYHSDISRYLNKRNKKPHPEKEKIITILKSEQI